MSVNDTLSVLGLVVSPFVAAYQWFDGLLQQSNLTGVYSAAILVVLVVRFILMPIVGSLRVGTGSDSARKQQPQKKE